MDQKIINLFDEYTHKPLKREDFIKRLTTLTGSLSAALAVLPLLEVNYSNATTVEENDEEIVTEDITYDAAGTVMKAYQARPKKEGKYGSVMVIHENRGLNPHIRDVTRRVAKAGFLAVAPDALSFAGGTPEDEEKARGLFSQIDPAKNLINFSSGFTYMTKHAASNGKTGVVGFCWGGAMTNELAVNVPELDAAVAYYGRQAKPEDVPKIKAQMLLHYGEMDERVNAGIPAFEEALKKAGVKYELFIYKGAQHAFNNDTAPTRYNAEVAKLAWDRTISLFKKTLS